MNLFSALSYKEWIKTRKVIGILFVAILAVLIYSFIDVTHSIRLENANNVWYGFIFMNSNLPSISYQIPLLAGLSLALVQFVPEMVNKRLKLTLHLPASESAIVSSMLIFGYLVLSGLFLLMVVVYTIGLNVIFPTEITCSLLSRFLPALVAGFAAYGFTAWICFEPQWKQRVYNLVIAVGLLSMLFVADEAGAYLHFGIGLVLLLVISFVLPFYSVIRFKHGVQ